MHHSIRVGLVPYLLLLFSTMAQQQQQGIGQPVVRVDDTLAHQRWNDPQFPYNPLDRGTALQYFEFSPFFDVNSNNYAARQRGLDPANEQQLRCVDWVQEAYWLIHSNCGDSSSTWADGTLLQHSVLCNSKPWANGLPLTASMPHLTSCSPYISTTPTPDCCWVSCRSMPMGETEFALAETHEPHLFVVRKQQRQQAAAGEAILCLRRAVRAPK